MSWRLILQGFIVGVGKIIPGISGSMLAMLMGIYEPLMEAVTHFFDDRKNKLIFDADIVKPFQKKLELLERDETKKLVHQEILTCLLLVSFFFISL